ncbi:bifunctional 2',3'-cyclic-nucleotide 2'-phosphodiesterase/3'-nucleotidase [Cohnella herbarum]|uniref:Bifunctional 2',3'-cyclic-nucleotide 2'-phosphodiesterase/3'-nucleotidase n=1 Tax=Cohnella herbarum TaxID=2728023 RepID=A0A7Z2ZQ41_9BACL|nr:bifunctional 2',3'-cyclic-nucleotide 2'-phosphodiesterase/3'-nucleotidase [Cohnella herbarum]QJD88116.1 bifunctional 2',3'-cyclic-nucleotide 2'-phosphodiesterase/3'-nucleotidase [Cohnella herbarum]
MFKMRPNRAILLSSVVAFCVIASPLAAVAAETDSPTVKLRIMETTDLHTNMVNYDYFSDKPTDEYGFAKTATLIKKARDEAKNSVLIDNGDLIQGNPLGDYVAKIAPLKKGETHPVFKAMNLVGYDVGNYGNHEFNFGLDFLANSVSGAKFPYINANVYKFDGDKDESNDVNMFKPYLILDKEVVDESGAKHKLKVGVIGFVPPQINQWDKANLEGKVITKDIVKTAEKFVPEMKSAGADLIIAVPHSGFEDIPQVENMENSVLYLSKVKGIDAILFGHAHKIFPSASFKDSDIVNVAKGTINGVPSVEPGFWGNNLGIIDLTLKQTDGKWSVADSAVSVKPIYDTANKKSLVDADTSVLDAVYEDHQHTLDYVRGSVGQTTAPINSFFALVQDDPSIQIVTNAQKWYVEKHLQGTEYEGIPVLSAGAPFKAGGRQGPAYFTDIPKGDIAIKNVSDLYLYSNTVNAVLVTGAEIQEWLEWSAGQFNKVDTTVKGKQELINFDFPTYNFDVIDGVTYQIDVTQPAKYDAKGDVLNAGSNRIKNLSYEGKPIDPDKKFIVATNNYRASSSKFANPDGKRIVLASPDENRQAIIDYIQTSKTINPSADGNWSLLPIKADVLVTFKTSPAAKTFASDLKTMTFVEESADGYSEYKLNFAEFSAPVVTAPEPETETEPEQEPEQEPEIIVDPGPIVSEDIAYIVKKGDTLSEIGAEYGVDWKLLAKINKLKNPNLIYVGQTIVIPATK